MPDDPHPPRGIDVTHVSPARSYDYLLGGVHNYEVDRKAAEAVIAQWPGMRVVGRIVRAWMIRTVAYLSTHVDQFLDIGSGLPTAENVHQVAQRAKPGAKVMYVDSDPIVLAHGRAILADNDHTEYIEADLRDRDIVLEAAADLLDLSRPIALIASSVLHFVEQNPADVLAGYLECLPSGSFLAFCHCTTEGAPPALVETVRGVWGGQWWPRSRDEIAAVFADLELVEPGLVNIERWRPAGNVAELELPQLGAVGRKP